MGVPSVNLDGKAYVILPRDEYERLTTLAKAAELPPVPKPDKHGNYPAARYARVSIARTILRDRAAAGLEQKELARLAGIRVETLCRIEHGKHTPTVATIQKIEHALQQVSGRKNTKR